MCTYSEYATNGVLGKTRDKICKDTILTIKIQAIYCVAGTEGTKSVSNLYLS